MGCKKAQGFLERAQLPIAEQTDARKDRRGRQEALTLAKSVSKVVIGKRKKVVTFDMKRDPPDDDALAAALLGPSGNLKAPTFRMGSTLVVGFSEAAYRQVLSP